MTLESYCPLFFNWEKNPQTSLVRKKYKIQSKRRTDFLVEAPVLPILSSVNAEVAVSSDRSGLLLPHSSSMKFISASLLVYLLPGFPVQALWAAPVTASPWLAPVPCGINPHLQPHVASQQCRVSTGRDWSLLSTDICPVQAIQISQVTAGKAV